jgi:hypothetical protein
MRMTPGSWISPPAATAALNYQDHHSRPLANKSFCAFSLRFALFLRLMQKDP